MSQDGERELEPFEDEPFEGDTGDDEVIGRAFRRSLQVITAVAALAALIVGVWWLWPQPVDDETILETRGPEVVEVASVEPPDVPFRDVTEAAGIDFVHESGATGEKLLPETMGSGVAFADLDGDDDPDLLFVNGARWPHDERAGSDDASIRVYRNRGDGTFEDVTEVAGLRTSGFYGTGIALGDVDADGAIDVFLTAVGTNRLYRGLGDGRFVDVTASAGVGGDAETWSTSAAFADVDGDGDLDLFVGNYVEWSRQIDAEVDYRLTGVGRAYGPPVNYAGTQSQLYLNQGDGRFVDVSEAAGLHVVQPETGVAVGKALGVAPVDVDRDGAIDLLVANDTVRNFLFHNRGDGTFEEVGELWGVAYGRAGEATGAMGVDAAYYRDGEDLGFAIGNFANEMTSLYVAQGDVSLFADEAIPEGVGAPSRAFLTFGMLWLDVDLDGRLDLLETNGHLENEIAVVDPSQTYAQPSQLFWNAGDAGRSTFVEMPAESIGDLARTIVGRGSAYADMDGDGDLDLVKTQTGRRPLLLRNDLLGPDGADYRHDSTPRWLRVRLKDPTSANRDALGARLTLRTRDGVQRRLVMPARGYQSASELPVTFGLGTGGAPVEGLEIQWPDGVSETVEAQALPTGRLVTIERGS